jgi:hypothetical protein
VGHHPELGLTTKEMSSRLLRAGVLLQALKSFTSFLHCCPHGSSRILRDLIEKNLYIIAESAIERVGKGAMTFQKGRNSSSDNLNRAF